MGNYIVLYIVFGFIYSFFISLYIERKTSGYITNASLSFYFLLWPIFLLIDCLHIFFSFLKTVYKFIIYFDYLVDKYRNKK